MYSSPDKPSTAVLPRLSPATTSLNALYITLDLIFAVRVTLLLTFVGIPILIADCDSETVLRSI